MKITTQGNGIRIGNRLEEKIASKMSKFNKFSGDDGTLNVRIRPEGQDMVVEITMEFGGKILRAEACDEDILTAVDRTVDKLESQIRRQKTKFLKKKKEFPGIVSYLEDDGGADFDIVDEKEAKITKVFRNCTYNITFIGNGEGCDVLSMTVNGTPVSYERNIVPAESGKTLEIVVNLGKK